MTHSIPDSSAVALGTELGHGADHRRLQVRPDPGRRPARRRLAAGRARRARGCCCCAATRPTSTAPGFSPSESVVGPHLEEVFARCEGADRGDELRLEHPPRPAGRRRRRTRSGARSRWSGARCARTSRIGRQLGHIEVPDGMLVGPREIDDFPDERVVIISDRLPGRAAVGAAADGLPRPPAGRAARRRHGRLLGHARSPATSARSTRRSTASTTSAAT